MQIQQNLVTRAMFFAHTSGLTTLHIHFVNLKQSSYKKVSGPQEGYCKKVVKSKWWPRNGCDGKLMAKVL